LFIVFFKKKKNHAQVRPVLNTLANGDSDDDVRFFAQAALSSLKV
jgi:hypothetical protein